MPSSVVHGAFALLLAAALLKGSYDRRALAVVLVVIALPEADTLLGVVMPGAHRSVGHNFVLPAAAGLLLYYDTRIRETSLLRERVDDWGVRVAWVALFAHFFAHVFLDWAHLDGVNALWPLHDEFFRLEGELYLSSREGLVQTFVDVNLDPETGERSVDAGSTGTTETVHVNNPVEPDGRRVPGSTEPVDRRFPLAAAGWQLHLIVVGVAVVAARALQAGDEAIRAEREAGE